MTLFTAVHRRWRNLPFAHKLGGLFIALVSIPIIVVVWYSHYSSREALIAVSQARNLERAQATAQVIDAFFADARADVRVIAGLSTVVDLCTTPASSENYDRAMRSLRAVRAQQGMLAVYVTDPAGRVLAATDGRAPLGSLQTGRAFLTAIAGDTAVDDPEYEEFDGRVALRISTAVRADQGEIIGTVTALVDVTAVDVLTREDENFGGFGEFGVLWTAIGVRLSHSNDNRNRFAPWTALPPDALLSTRQRLGPAFPTSVPFEPAFAGVADRGQWLLYDGGTNPHVRIETREFGVMHVTAVPLRGQRWVYGIFVPEAQLLSALQTQVIRDWAVAFFTVLAALTLSMIAARWVTRPLRLVTEAADALAKGDMHRRVRLDQRDEFGQLGATFDAMAAAIEDKESQLQAHAATLERRVEERTSTLQLLERASRALASSLELRRTAANLATLLVPGAADFCSVDIRDLNGNLRRIACRHADPAREQVANQLADIRPARDPIATLTADERTKLGLTDLRVYELSAGRQFVGNMTIAMTGEGRGFAETDERVFEELGRRAGLALANALLYQEAQDANRLKDEFLGVVSHELRTPLNAIIGWTRLAGAPREAGISHQQALEAIDRNARALARLVDDLLDVPRIMMGKLALDLRPLDLVAMVRTCVDGIRPGASAKSLRVHFWSDVPEAIVEADAQRLQQAVGNLLSNAVKFTRAGGQIDVRVDADQTTYVITVTDTGVGITKDFLPFVFERFRQADSSTTRAQGGLGLGLAIVRHLVEMHGGQVSAASPGVERGSTFSVRLPRAVTDPRMDMHPADVKEPVATDRLEGMRLLVLDDDHDSLEVARRMLESAGATVSMATTVASASTVLAHQPDDVDAVLADIGLPGEDGYAFIGWVREAADARLRSLPVVAVTAYASRSDRARALAAGFDAHVPKPVSLSAIVEALNDAFTARAR